jgi:histidine ammonia-lyase
MSMGAAWKARRAIDNVRNVLAIELMCAAQGIDYRAPLKPGKKLRSAHAKVRSIVPPLVADRVLSPDIMALSDAIGRGVFDDDNDD